MASKNQVTLTMAGDSTKLESAFDKVGASAKTMGDDVGKASKKVGDSTDGFDKLDGGLDNTYDKFDSLEAVGRGTTDTMSGLSEIMKGNLLQGSTDLAGGVAALADGFAGALVPAMKSGVTWIKNTTIAQKALNLAQRMNPIGIIITLIVLLVTALVVAYKKSETFRKIVQGAMRGVAAAFGWIVNGFAAAWRAVSGAWSRFAGWVAGWRGAITRRVSAIFSGVGSSFGSAWSTVSGAWSRFAGWVAGWRATIYNRVISIFSGVGSSFGSAWSTVSGAWSRFAGWVAGWPGAISRRVGGMWNGIRDGFRSALNWIIDRWNGLSFSMPSVDTHIPGVGRVGGWTLHTPDIPRFHSGGIMPGAPGTEGLALLQAGERITPPGRGGKVEVVLRIEGRGDLVELLRNSLRSKGVTVEGLTG